MQHSIDEKDLPRNSYLKAPEAEKEKEKRQPQTPPITTGKIHRQSLGEKIADVFLVGDMDSVKDHLIYKVIVPYARNFISDALNGVVDVLVYGKGSPVKGNGGQKNDYNAAYKYSFQSQSSNNQPQQPKKTRNGIQVTVDSRWEAKDVIDAIVATIQTNGRASVADLYDRLKIDATWNDTKIGWTEAAEIANGVSIVSTRDGFTMTFPPVESINI